MNETNLTKEDFWMKRIQDFQKSGLSRKEWCQENQVVTIHSHFTHMRKNSQQSCLPMLRILIFCLCV